MNRCRHPEHPHCTVWVLPNDGVCEHGHTQPVATAAEPDTAELPKDTGLPLSYEAIRNLRARRDTVIAPAPAAQDSTLQRPLLHISGFDPRAAGGRQAIRLELRGMPMDCSAEVRMLVRSSLKLQGGASYGFQRTTRGEWRPLFLEFSSRGVEHGQHRIEIELHSRHPQTPSASRTWVCSPVILVPRPDAGLAEIHQTFLATHKNVRVTADDAGIARVHAPGGGRIDIDVTARNASIAHVNLDGDNHGGKIALAMSTIAWDEDLIEIDMAHEADVHPCPASSACLVHAEADSATQRHVRLFALDECVLGRFEAIEPDADLLLAHHGEAGPEQDGLTRRLSGRHAIIRRGRAGFEIEDVSRYGLLLDGVWPGKHLPTLLRLGMRIEFTASIKGIVTLEVTALLPHAVVLHRLDAGARAECFYLMAPECAPHPSDIACANVAPRAATLPLMFHRDGGFWQLNRASGQEQPLAPDTRVSLSPGSGFGAGARFTPEPYPETRVNRRAATERRTPAQPVALNA